MDKDRKKRLKLFKIAQSDKKKIFLSLPNRNGFIGRKRYK